MEFQCFVFLLTVVVAVRGQTCPGTPCTADAPCCIEGACSPSPCCSASIACPSGKCCVNGVCHEAASGSTCDGLNPCQITGSGDNMLCNGAAKICNHPFVPNTEATCGRTGEGCGWINPCNPPPVNCTHATNTTTQCGSSTVRPTCTNGFTDAHPLSCCCVAAVDGERCEWAGTCAASSPCLTCSGNPCAAPQVMHGGVCQASSDGCAWTGYTCQAPVTTCLDSNCKPLLCGIGHKSSADISPVCAPSPDHSICTWTTSNCVDDPCQRITNDCDCDYNRGCAFFTHSELHIAVCASLDSDYGKHFGDTSLVTKERPSRCTTHEMSHDVVGTDKPVQGILEHSGTNAATAVNNFVQCLANIKTMIDAQTGIKLGAHFDVVCGGVGVPQKTTNGDYDVTVICVATPASNVVVTLSTDHERVLRPCIRKFIADLIGVTSDSISDPTITSQTSLKRAIEGSSTTVSATSTVPGSVACNTFGCSSASGVFTSLLAFVAVVAFYLF